MWPLQQEKRKRELELEWNETVNDFTLQTRGEHRGGKQEDKLEVTRAVRRGDRKTLCEGSVATGGGNE